MFNKRSLILALIGISLFAVLLAGWSIRIPEARAQCGDIRSSCYKCHQETDPVCGTTAWHSEFSHRYACWSCHGGNDTAQDKEQAHMGLVANPLADAYTSCYYCHPDDYQQLAAQYAQSLGMTASYSSPITQSAVAFVPIATPRSSPATTTPNATVNSPDWRLVLWLLPVAALLVLSGFVWNKRRSV